MKSDGVSAWKTNTKNYPADGPKEGIDGSPYPGGKARSVTSKAMKQQGRNLARAANQGK